MAGTQTASGSWRYGHASPRAHALRPKARQSWAANLAALLTSVQSWAANLAALLTSEQAVDIVLGAAMTVGPSGPRSAIVQRKPFARVLNGCWHVLTGCWHVLTGHGISCAPMVGLGLGTVFDQCDQLSDGA